ncbi:ATP-binding protein [Paraburkholderia sp. PREW-6R]|uniref:AAA family ATPase n=1 Tax=Paraburkholderia sp. PREW-6R TaxID=3141544 RepID=UPI0031F5BF44
MTHLVFFCGHAGTGKTTLARRMIGPLMRSSAAPFCLLDKDILYGGYSSAAMTLLTGDPYDRDSPLFLDHLRDPEYRGLIDTARDNLELGVSAIVVAPLSREVRERRLFDHAWLGVGADVTSRVVWVHTSEETAHRRIVERGNPNDAYKLAHWDDYRKRRFVPAGDMAADLLMFDNTAPASQDYEALLAGIL